MAILKNKFKKLKKMASQKVNSEKNLHNKENEILIKGKKDIYSINDTIGKGTFGKVKIAYSKIRNPHKKYACKILEQSNMKEKDDKKRCQREMSILLQMNHKNVIKTSEIITDSSRYYIIMEYCSKGELFNHIVEQQHFDEEKSAFYYYQLISGIEYIHSKKVCHRDLKPENLLLNEDNILKIIDFGLSNFFFEENKLLTTPCGSPCYASPEMILGNKYDGFCIDIWSSGIILYAMLCGYLPFEEGEGDINNELLFRNIVECKVEYPNEFVSSMAKDLLGKILVRDPKKRITIKQIKKHPFFLLGKDIYFKKYRDEKDSTSKDYNYATFRHFPTMNFNDIDINYRITNNGYINVNRKNKKYDSLNIDFHNDYNYNDIYVKTNYNRSNYLNSLENDINDIATYKFFNTSFNNENDNDININHHYNIKEGNYNIDLQNKKNNRSVNNKVNININLNKSLKNKTSRNKNSINYIHKNSMTLESKINNNNKKILGQTIKIEKPNKTIKNLKPKLNCEQYNHNLFTLNNNEPNYYSNYLETNYNSITNNNYENDIKIQYMKTDINFTKNRFKSTDKNNFDKKYSKNINTNININNYFNYKNSKKKQNSKNAFRKEKNNTPQISLHKGLVYNSQNQKPSLEKNEKKNNTQKNIYNNFIDKKELLFNNNINKDKYSIEIRNYSKNNKLLSNNTYQNKKYKNKINKSINSIITNSYNSNLINFYNNYNYGLNKKSLNPKDINRYQQINNNLLTENGRNPISINKNNPYTFNTSIKQFLKNSTNKKINKNNKQNKDNKKINNYQNQNLNYNYNYQKTKSNYNLDSIFLENSKVKSNKSSRVNLAISQKENYTSRPKSQKQNIIRNKTMMNNNYSNDKKIINNILYKDKYINNNDINKKKNLYNENPKNNNNNNEINNNKIIINLNILKPKIIVDDEKNNNNNNIRKKKYSSSLIQTYNNIDINAISNNILYKNKAKKINYHLLIVFLQI